MTSEEFVMNFRKEKDYMLNMYFDETSDSYTGELIRNLVKKGADTAEIKELLKSVLNEAFYTILMGLDGEASLGDMQMQFSI